MKHILTFPRLLAIALLAILVLLSLGRPLGAQTPFTQGYGTDEPVQKGMVIRLKDGDTSKVSPLSDDEIEKMHGVVVDANDAAVTLSAEGQKVFVAATGQYEVLVSNQNGNIAAGDYVTISALRGVGMKAGESELMVVGRALQPFDDQTQIVSTAAIRDSAGGERTVKLARILVDINIARNPLLKGAEPNLPDFLQRASESIAGKPVDASRVYIGVVIFLLTTAVSASLLYGGARSGIISIGRNPLSKKLIIRGMFQVIISGLIIFILGLFGVYLLLRL